MDLVLYFIQYSDPVRRPGFLDNMQLGQRLTTLNTVLAHPWPLCQATKTTGQEYGLHMDLVLDFVHYSNSDPVNRPGFLDNLQIGQRLKTLDTDLGGPWRSPGWQRGPEATCVRLSWRWSRRHQGPPADPGNLSGCLWRSRETGPGRPRRLLGSSVSEEFRKHENGDDSDCEADADGWRRSKRKGREGEGEEVKENIKQW